MSTGVFFALFLSIFSSSAFAVPDSVFKNKGEFAKHEPLCGSFHLTSYLKRTDPEKPLHIYIEGDGFAWRSRRVASSDPTPRSDLMTKWAASDPSPNIAYLARPCQYSSRKTDDLCKTDAYWTSQRYSDIAYEAMDQAVDHLKKISGSQTIQVTAYSGGAVFAIELAARRNDIEFIRTVAGNLDPDEVNRYHHVDGPTGGLNPMKQAARVSHIRQEHWIGSEDRTIPPYLADTLLKKMGDPKNAVVKIVQGASHDKGWDNLK